MTDTPAAAPATHEFVSSCGPMDCERCGRLAWDSIHDVTDTPAAAPAYLPSLRGHPDDCLCYHCGYERGRAAGVAEERQRIAERMDDHVANAGSAVCCLRWARADLLDGGGQDGGPDDV